MSSNEEVTAKVLASIVSRLTNMECELKFCRELMSKQAELIQVQTDEIRELKTIVLNASMSNPQPNTKNAVPIDSTENEKTAERSSTTAISETASIGPNPGRATVQSRHSRRNILIFSQSTNAEPKSNMDLQSHATSTKVPNTQDMNHTIHNVQDSDNEWREVQHKKRRAPLSLRCVAGPSVTSLKAAESRKHFHLWNMLSSVDEIKIYLSELCPQRIFTVEQLKMTNHYNTFKIGVPEDCYETCFSVNVWPENARVKQWINYKKRVPISTDSQSFQRGVGTQ